MCNINFRPQELAFYLVLKFSENQITKIPDLLLRPWTIRPFGQSPLPVPTMFEVEEPLFRG
jgi:hypothetical protein